ncbi:S41 family peptidase [Bernardetia sp. MNP-M8]|uniref:S41 family peptidase n=1 Tax=Bernardetia sp. MNP-M8 TaxID=3127470 RepID=UPI0030D5E986
MKLNFIYLISLLTFLLFSCEKGFFEEPVNDPETNFEIFWKEFDEYYAPFEFKDLNWQDEYSQNRPLVTPITTNEELWNICTQMIDKLDDSHTFMIDYYHDKKFFLSGSRTREHAIAEFSRKVVRENYMNFLYEVARDTAITYGLIQGKNIGYIHFGDMQGDYPRDIQKIVEKFDNTEGLIVDIRNNGGGDPDYAFTSAGAFSDGEHFIFTVQSKNGSAHDDFDEPTKKITQKPDGYRYLKPVVLITDRQTISAGEDFCLNMKAFSHVYHIGDKTSGGTSNLSAIRTLPNGWAFGFSYQKTLSPSGVSFEGVGIPPDFFIKNTNVDIQQGIDKVLEYAIAYLE